MRGLTTELPSGWRVVDSSQEGFDSILQRVIVPYGWHVDALVTSGASGQMQGWRTAAASFPGASYGHVSWVKKVDASRFHFEHHTTSRLLIQAHPSADHELMNNWKRYVQLSAQREWAQRLGMPHGGSIEE